MARPSLNDILGLQDVLSSESYTFEFGTLPTGASTRSVTLLCQSCVLPGVSNEKIQTTLGGHTVNHRGRVIQSHSIPCTFVETRNALILNSIRDWHSYCANVRSGNSAGYKTDYAITARLTMYDTTGAVAYAHNVYGVFPESIDDTSLDGTSSAATLINATFSYDSSEPV